MLVFIIIALCVFALVVKGWFFIYKLLSKGALRNFFIIITSVFLLFIGYSIYDAIYPDNIFFEDEFVKALKLRFPSSGQIISKDASYPDTHGKYCSCSLIQTNSKDFKNTFNYIINNKQFTQNDSGYVHTEEFNNVLGNFKGLYTTNNIIFNSNNSLNTKNRVSIFFVNRGNKLILQRCNF